LKLDWRGKISSHRSNSDQFWPASTVDRQSGDLWACFYDTSGDSNGKRAWFTCALSRDGRRWSAPARVAATPSSTDALWEDARLYGFEDEIAFGGYVSVAAADGLAHPLWIDTSGSGGRDEEVDSATLRATDLTRRAGG